MSENCERLTALSVLRAGVHSALQDLGRFGVAQHGLSQGGAMDLQAHCWANRLLENRVTCATLEITVGMASFSAETDLLMAVTGADMLAELDGVPVGNWCSFAIKAGQKLNLKASRQGMRTYLAVKGGFRAEPVHGSVSTVVRNDLGSILREGDLLAAASHPPARATQVPARYLPAYPEEIVLRVIESCQAKDFPEGARERFYRSEFTVTPHGDRMGVRLEGEAIEPPPAGIVSEGIALGAIQVPADGQPIVLLNDRQTLGGYPKLGVVARVDLPKLAQARPGTRIRFTPLSLDRARGEWQDFCAYFNL